MLNDKFEVIHLKQRKIITPLFTNAMEAYSLSSEPRKHPATYLVIDSTATIDQRIFTQTNICPVYIYASKSYVFLEGECLWRYFLARKESDNVLPEQQLWTMMTQITSALIVLRQNGYEHRHLRQYAVRRISADHFKLIYHPEMVAVTQIIEQKNERWCDFYLAPEQLPPHLSNQQSNSCVFSLGAMALNLMNPLDFKRDIYSKQSYALNSDVIDSKMKNILSLYSPSMAEIIRNTLMPDPAKRIKLNQLQKLIVMLNPSQKKMQVINSIKPYVTSKLSNSRSKKKRSQPKEESHSIEKYNKTISFIRGTFGNEDSAQSNLQFERGTFGGHPHRQTEKSSGTLRGSLSSGESNSKYINQQIDYPLTTSISYRQYLQQANKQKKQQAAVLKLSGSQQATPFRYLSVSSASKDHVEASPKQKKCSVEDSSLNLSNFSILKPSHELGPIQEELTGFKTKLQHYQLQLNQCLQPLGDLIADMNIPGLRINEDTYYGQLKNGRRNGLGLEIFPNRQYYYGFFKDDLFHGEGFYFWNRTKYFLGTFENGNKLEGSWWGAGIKYVGQIAANRRHGIGSCYYSNGRIYEGEWFEGRRHGSGILSEPSGQQFVGCFKSGQKYGKGSFLADSCRIIGIWNEDEPVGQVQIIYDNGNRYKGTINKNYEKQGSGEFRFCGGCVCKGKFWEDEFVNGEIQYRNGERYVGDTKGFQRHGTGVYYYNNGKIVYGEWRQGIIIRQFHS